MNISNAGCRKEKETEGRYKINDDFDTKIKMIEIKE
jgi:hypothetical protein